MRDELSKVLAKIVISALNTNIVGRPAIESRVIPRYVTINRDHDDGVRSNEVGDLWNSIQSLVVGFQRVPVAVSVEVIDHRKGFGRGLVIRREEYAVVAKFREDLRRIGSVFVRLRGSKRDCNEQECERAHPTLRSPGCRALL